MGLAKKTVLLTIVVDDEGLPRRMPIVLGAIRGILPSLDRIAESVALKVEDEKNGEVAK